MYAHSYIWCSWKQKYYCALLGKVTETFVKEQCGIFTPYVCSDETFNAVRIICLP